VNEVNNILSGACPGVNTAFIFIQALVPCLQNRRVRGYKRPTMNFPKNVPEKAFHYHYKHDPKGEVNNYAYEVIGVGIHTHTTPN